MYRPLLTTLIVTSGTLACLIVTSCCTSVENDAPMGATSPIDQLADKPVPNGNAIVITAFPLTERSGQFELIVDKKSPKRVSSTFQKIDGKKWSLKVDDLREILFLVDGESVTVVRDVDVKENVRVDYDPPLAFLSSSLAKGQPINGESAMTVRNRQTGAIRDQGKCFYQVSLIGEKQIETKLGKLDVQHIRMTRKINLNLAKVDITIDQLRHAKFGLVRSYTVRNTKALGLFGSTTTEDLTLVEYETKGAIQETEEARD